MKTFSPETLTYEKFKNEITQGSGVVAIKNVYSKEQINLARDIVNKCADTQESKETNFNAEADGLKVENIIDQLIDYLKE